MYVRIRHSHHNGLTALMLDWANEGALIEKHRASNHSFTPDGQHLR